MITLESLERLLNDNIKKIKDLHSKTLDLYVIKDLQMYYSDLELIKERLNWANTRDFYYLDSKLRDIKKILNRIKKGMTD